MRASVWLCLALLVAQPARSKPWQAINPGGGGAFVDADRAPSTSRMLVAADMAGIYYSDNDGESWSLLGGHDGFTNSHQELAAFFSDDTAYVGGEGGLWRSTTVPYGWLKQALPFGVAPPRVRSIAWGLSTIYVAGDTSDAQIVLWKSTDRGASWSQLSTTGLPSPGCAVKLLVEPGDTSHVLLVSQNCLLIRGVTGSLYRSADGGLSWTNIGPVVDGGAWEVADAAYDGNGLVPADIYASVYLDEGPHGRVYRSTDQGQSWGEVFPLGGNLVVTAPAHLSVWDVKQDYAKASGDSSGVWTTASAGLDWSHGSSIEASERGWTGVSSWAYGKNLYHIANTIRAGGRLWLTSSFVWKSTNGGDTWTSAFTQPLANTSPPRWSSRGIDNSSPMAIAKAGGWLFAGWADLGVWRSPDGGQSWESSNDSALTNLGGVGWDGHGGNAYALVADPSGNGHVWATNGPRATATNVIRSTAEGAPGSWVKATSSASTAFADTFVSALAIDPSSAPGSRVVYAVAAGRLYRSSDDGQSFGLACDCDGGVRVAAVSGSLVLAGGEAGLFKSVDGGSSFTRIASATFPPEASTSLMLLKQRRWVGPHAIVIDGSHYAVASYGDGSTSAPDRGVLVSSDGGVTWKVSLLDGFSQGLIRDGSGHYWHASGRKTQSGGDPMGSSGVASSLDPYAGTPDWRFQTDGLVWDLATCLASSGGAADTIFCGGAGSGLMFRPASDAGTGDTVGGYGDLPATGRWYDIQGRVVDPGRRSGVVFQRGRKVVIIK